MYGMNKDMRRYILKQFYISGAALMAIGIVLTVLVMNGCKKSQIKDGGWLIKHKLPGEEYRCWRTLTLSRELDLLQTHGTTGTAIYFFPDGLALRVKVTDSLGWKSAAKIIGVDLAKCQDFFTTPDKALAERRE